MCPRSGSNGDRPEIILLIITLHISINGINKIKKGTIKLVKNENSSKSKLCVLIPIKTIVIPKRYDPPVPHENFCRMKIENHER